MNEIGFSVGRERLLMCSGSECWVIGLGSAPGLSSSQAIRLSSKPRVWRGVGCLCPYGFYGSAHLETHIFWGFLFFFLFPFFPFFCFFCAKIPGFFWPP